MQNQLSVRHSLGTSDRVVQLCFHPVQPWLVYVDKNSAVHVLNWSSQEVVFSAQFGGLDEAAVHYQTLQKMAEQDTAFWGHKTSQDLEVSRTVSGKVRMVKFFDVETLFWQQVSQLSTIKGKVEEYPGNTVAGGDVLMGQRWLLVVCDNKLVLHEMLSHTSREISKVTLEGKSPTTVATLTGPQGSSLRYEPILCLGCSDGAIRIVSFSTLKVIGKLGQKAGSVSCLMTLHLTSTLTRLVSGASDGSLSIWDPFPGGNQSSSALIPPSVVIKAHEGEVMGLELSYGPNEAAISRIITIGADRTAAAWDVGTFKEVLRFKQPSQRLPCHSVCYSPAFITSPISYPILMATNANKVWGASASNGAFKSLAETGTLLGSTGKSAGKIYAMAVHPLQTHLIAIGVGSGLAVLTASAHSHPCMMMLPGEKDSKSPGYELTVLAPTTTSLHQREYMAVQKDGNGESSKQGRSPELLQDNMVISGTVLELTGHCIVIPHHSGLKLALVWPTANKYKIFRRIGPTDWERCYEGDGKHVVWHLHTSVLAVLDCPDPIPVPTTSERRIRGRAKPDQAAMDALAAAAVPDPSLKIIRVPAAGHIQPEGQLNFSGTPTQLFGGPILGVTSSFAPGDQNIESQFQFYDWRTKQTCSPDMPAPQWISWSPEGDVCAMAYPTHILICEAIGSFTPVTSVPISHSTSGVWENRELYIATPFSIECVAAPRMANTQEGTPELLVQVITLASFRAGPKWLTGAIDDSEALPQPRPYGQLSVLGVRGDNLWLVDTLGHPVLVDLAIPGFSSLRLVGDKNFGAARSAAVGKVPADNLASLLVGMGTKSAVEALKLPSLSLEVRLRVAIKARYLKHALVCLEALALGCDRPEVVVRLPEFRDTLKDQDAKDDIGESKFVTYGALDITEGPFVSTSNPGEVQDDGAGGIDWCTSLKESTKAKASGHGRTLMLRESVAELGIELIDAATEARLNNTAMKTIKLLLKHLPPETASELLLRVQTRLAERGKKKELEEITELTERAKMTTSGRFAGLAAAALSGNYLVMTNVLKELKMMSA